MFSCLQLKGDSIAPKYAFFESHSKSYKHLLIDAPKPTWQLDVKVVDILKSYIYLLYKILGALILGGT